MLTPEQERFEKALADLDRAYARLERVWAICWPIIAMCVIILIAVALT